jgi:hypothetical protein
LVKKNKTIATLLILVTVLSVMQLSSSIANPYTQVPTLSILSPHPSWERCYSNASIPIKIGILLSETSNTEEYTPHISYNLDNGENITLTNITKGEHWAKEYPLQPPVSFTASATLYNLTEGNHTLSAYSFGSDGKVLSDEIIFTVDSSYKNPELTLISPKKLTYTTSQVQLIFSTNKEYKNARYILDYHLESQRAQGYISINGNITLTNLTDGTHKIILFADCYDNYHNRISISQGTSFNVSINANNTKAENTTEAQNNLTIDYKLIFLTTAAVAVILVISCFVLGYSIRKNKHLNNQRFFQLICDS